MAQYYDFAGQKIILPGGYSKRNFPSNQGGGAASGKVLILGEVTGGGISYNATFDGASGGSVENIINRIDGQSTALAVFGGGPLYHGAEFFLTPTMDSRFSSPSEADCIIVNQMTQAVATLDASAIPIIDVAFNIWGLNGNQSAIQIQSGSVIGKALTLLYRGNKILDVDNVQMPLLSIQYTGDGSAAALTISETKLTTTVTGASGEDLDITLADYNSLGELVSAINDNAVYTCLLLGQSDELTTIFDIVVSQAIKASAYDCQAIVEALIRTITSSESFTATLNATATRVVPDNLANYTYLAGGTVTAAQTADWTAVLTMLESYDVNNLVIMSSSTVVQGLVNTHCEKMNGIQYKKYRQWGAGASGSTGSTNTKALKIAQMKALGSAYAEYCVSSFQRFNYLTNAVETFDPFYLYPLVSGLRYANKVGMDVVFKYLNVLSTPDISKADQEAYAAAGATLIQKSTSVLNGATNFEIKVNNTCYQGGQVTRTNPGVVYAINVLTKDLEEQVIEKIRSLDGVADILVMAGIENWITSYLLPKYRDVDKWITNYNNPITGRQQKAFDNVVFVQEGEVLRMSALLTMSVTPRFVFNFLTFITPGQLL